MTMTPVSRSSKTYLVTGAAGFIGSRFVEYLNGKTEGCRLLSVDEAEFFSSRPQNAGIDFGVQVDRKALFEWLKDMRPRIDAIVHLGAVTDTRETDLTKLNDLNVGYSQRLWTYATEKKIPFVYASSAATYGDGAQGYDDDEARSSQLKPLNAYGDSKQTFDLWALDQERKAIFPPSWSGFKFFNVYGFGENHKGFMASVVLHAYEQLKSSGQVTLFKSHRAGILDGHQKRDFVCVEDVVRVLDFAVQKPIMRGIFNLGTGEARTFLDLTRAVFAAMKTKEKIAFVDTPVSIRDKYQYFTQATMLRLRAQGYEAPFLSLEEGVRRYIERLLAPNAQSH